MQKSCLSNSISCQTVFVADIFLSDFELTSDQVKLLPELWGMVFRKLDFHDLRQKLGLVCKEWHDMIQNDPLFSSELKIRKEK